LVCDITKGGRVSPKPTTNFCLVGDAQAKEDTSSVVIIKKFNFIRLFKLT
jgi:hypothetical protein